jgi:hypothetical protein
MADPAPSSFEDLRDYAAARLREGFSLDRLRADLESRHVPADHARQLVAQAAAQNRWLGLRSGMKFFLIGLAFLLLDLICAAPFPASDSSSHALLIFALPFALGGLLRMLYALFAGK